ncbi:unnamed protein product [Symbiodinium pilosum]|uniref:Uncharacterized protein n=1 Tax=Symbiodinium pilosum TaxID=2952 RepID=A0A812TEH2_SYMPI|nr:unnamed protein product [Symbiodinium pilosum]
MMAAPDQPQASGMECWFGKKHYGRAMNEVLAADPGYCRWMVQKAEEADPPPELREDVAWLLQHAPHLKEPREFVEGGKHRGRLLSELVKEDPAYCRWILQHAEEETALPVIREKARWLKQNAPYLKEQPEVPVLEGGRHNGRLLSEVVVADPSYCRWLIGEAEVGRTSRCLRKAAGWLSKHAPHLKAEDGAWVGGNYRGRHISELVTEDPAYCQWVLRVAKEEDASSAIRDQEIPVVNVRGRHRGIPLPQVVAEDPHWCLFVLNQNEPAQWQLRGFADAADWLRGNANELVDVNRDDEAALAEIGQACLQRYGGMFTVRNGKFRMRSFQTVTEEAPGYVEWIQQRIKNASAMEGAQLGTKNFQLLAAYYRQRQMPRSGGDAGKKECKTL